MRIRILFAALGLVLAVVGIVAVNLYARDADARALRDQQPVDVLVVKQDVPAGTPAEGLADFLEVRKIPQASVATGAVTTLGGLEGLVTSVDLVTGEQLIATRLVAPEALDVPGRVDVPSGLQEVTVQLSADRVVGGALAPGDTVGVVVTSGESTHMRLHKVLVTSLQGLAAPAEGQPEGETPIPGGSVFVTLAVTAPDAEIVVNAVENASVWLTKEPADASTDGTRVVTPEVLLQ